LRTLRAALVPEDAVQAQERWTSLAQALLLCTQLTALRLRCVFLKDELLLPVLRAVPQLQSLLVEQAQLSSLRCFADVPHLAKTLQQLDLSSRAGRVAPDELLPGLRPLRALRELSVECLTAPLSADVHAQLTPGDAGFAVRFWPQMKSVWLR